ncbi:hypothetical protein E5676_scaffold142G003250 [Cucumis melo var. makuwa]|uniref:Uncharacterized protein n=1 Tax=Cucumis melo var. makuwa TaxID=1194695 RepID=A0A5D3DHY1_CUCMM|nr:hypothetical protein E5676_scaffold142G003250 [Cucumis melo var. makuwa]
MTHSKREKKTTSEVAKKTSLPSSPKQTQKPTTQNTKQKEAARDDKDDKDYFFKFIDDQVCKPLGSGFQDVFQCQSNLQEMQYRHKKQSKGLELKVDNTRA